MPSRPGSTTAFYKRLRDLGVSAKESARVADASAKTPSKKASQRGGAASSYAHWKVPELRARAKKVGIRRGIWRG